MVASKVQPVPDEQALFGADYKSRFQHGGNRTEQDASTGVLNNKDYCNQFGFALRTVQRWCEKLLGPEKAAGKVSARIEIGSRLPNLSWSHHQPLPITNG